jgi:DNA-binding transcriptional LysR family regulator
VNFQQLRSVREAVRRGFNLTAVAEALHTSQPGVSRQIRELEDELGVEIFVRAGKRLTGLTPPGHSVLPIVERLLQEADNLRRAGEDFASDGRGTLTIAATPCICASAKSGSARSLASEVSTRTSFPRDRSASRRERTITSARPAIVP